MAQAGFGILIGNCNNNRTPSNTSIVNCYNYGTVEGFGYVNFVSTGSTSEQQYVDKADTINTTYADQCHNVNGGSITKLLPDGSDITRNSDNQYIIKKGTDATSFKVSFVEYIRADRISGGASFKLNYIVEYTFTAAGLGLENSGDQAAIPYKRSLFRYYERWKELTGTTYTGEWSICQQGARYFYDAERRMFVFDIKSEYEAYLQEHGLDPNDWNIPLDSGSLANVRFLAYDADGKTVAFKDISGDYGA